MKYKFYAALLVMILFPISIVLYVFGRNELALLFLVLGIVSFILSWNRDKIKENDFEDVGVMPDKIVGAVRREVGGG